MWHGAFRCVFDSGRNVYIERGNVIQKVPRRWVRIRKGMTTDSPMNEQHEKEAKSNEKIWLRKVLNRLVPEQEASSSSTDPQDPVPMTSNESLPKDSGGFVPWKKYHLRSSEQALWNEVMYAFKLQEKLPGLPTEDTKTMMVVKQ